MTAPSTAMGTATPARIRQSPPCPQSRSAADSSCEWPEASTPRKWRASTSACWSEPWQASRPAWSAMATVGVPSRWLRLGAALTAVSGVRPSRSTETAWLAVCRTS